VSGVRISCDTLATKVAAHLVEPRGLVTSR
jgi:hypothetical protein